jgi:hypothetical protein
VSDDEDLFEKVMLRVDGRRKLLPKVEKEIVHILPPHLVGIAKIFEKNPKLESFSKFPRCK